MSPLIELIHVVNSCKRPLISAKKLKYMAGICYKILPYQDWALSVEVCDDSTMKKINRQQRGINKSTDILTFPANAPTGDNRKLTTTTFDQRSITKNKYVQQMISDVSSSGGSTENESMMIPHYGSIIINEPYVLKHCKENNIDMNDHLPMLLVHGLVHSLHYDHETDEESAEMEVVERAMLRHLYLTMGYEPASSSNNLWSRIPKSSKNLESSINWSQLLNLQ